MFNCYTYRFTNYVNLAGTVPMDSLSTAYKTFLSNAPDEDAGD